MKPWIFIVIAVSLIILLIWIFILASDVQASEGEHPPDLKLINATAYYDSYKHGYGATGRKLVEDLTLAGRVEDLGKTALLYDTNFRLIGIYEFTDVGYGKPTGKGKSKVCMGKSIGTIENGSCIDIYMGSYTKCKEWGKRQVYIQIIDAKG